MSKRISNERARDILKDTRQGLEVDTKTLLQALDIAIESLIKQSEYDMHTHNVEFQLKLAEKKLNELGYAFNEYRGCIIAIDSLDNEWIDVRDRLPSESGMYLVTVDEGYRKHTTEWFYGTSGEEGWDEFEGHEDIIAWKPLPQPYERKE